MFLHKNILSTALILGAAFSFANTASAAVAGSAYPEETSPPATLQAQAAMNAAMQPPPPAPVAQPTTGYPSYPSGDYGYARNAQLAHPQPGQRMATNLSDLPQYQYRSSLDPKMNPKPVPPPPPERSGTRSPLYMPLDTRSGIDIGATAAYYKYEEPDFPSSPVIDVKEDGAWFGGDIVGTLVFGGGLFTELDGRFAFGWLDYSGSGTADAEWTDSMEARALFGKDFVLTQYSISPYLGIGYRNLYNDARGVTSTGANGYRRENTLYYIPIGAYQRTHIDTFTRLTSMLEYDFLLHGNQKSYLSDADPGLPDINNGQKSGYGIRGNIMYERKSWAIGPYVTYWHIDDSKVSSGNGTTANACAPASAPCIISGLEPHNFTLEAGVKFTYHVW